MQTTRQNEGIERQQSALYFRRWTRSHAAVFRSLGRCVVIGHLAISVLERLAGKSQNLLREFTLLQLTPQEREEEQDESEATLLIDRLPHLLLTSTHEVALAISTYVGRLSASPHI